LLTIIPRRCVVPEFRKSVVTKQQPASLVRRELFRCGPVFRNETAVYSTVIPAFQRFFGDIVALPFPKCLHADHDVRSDLIILEDLRTTGFIMTNRKEGLDVDHCQLVLQVWRETAFMILISNILLCNCGFLSEQLLSDYRQIF
jgi:hypothetical protein